MCKMGKEGGGGGGISRILWYTLTSWMVQQAASLSLMLVCVLTLSPCTCMCILPCTLSPCTPLSPPMQELNLTYHYLPWEVMADLLLIVVVLLSRFLAVAGLTIYHFQIMTARQL